MESRIRWGFLTNGGLWRLYDYRARPRATGYFEVDLGEMLESGGEDGLRLFYLLFRRDSFTPQQGATTSFLEAALAQGRRYEEKVAQDLSSVVFERVFPKLVQALADATGDDLSRVRHAALILLYRLLFVLYAEDRGLLPVNDPRYEDYGLRKPVRDHVAHRMQGGGVFSASASSYYDHLMTLFRQIDEGDESIGLPPYNGGLFASEAAPLLKTARLTDKIVGDIIYDLSHTETEGTRHFVNYWDMSVQQLGSIYERLLEREPVRDDNGGVVVRPNSYARKDSGSFFTPQELVDLIVDRTLKPLAEERLKAFEDKAKELRSDHRPIAERHAELLALDPAEAVLDLKVLDPAMGSGHFLVTTVDFFSDYIAELAEYVPAVPEWLDGEYSSPLVERVAAIRRDILQRAQVSDWVMDETQLTDQAIIRRMVLKRCIYGVDKNPLTVELAKVSLWLHSFTVGAPLSFLDHHLRCGDSLVGLRVPGATAELNRLGGLFASSAIASAEAATSGMQRIEEMSDADVAEVRESAELFRGVEDTTADLRGLLDFLCGLRWLTSDMRGKARAALETPLVETLGSRPNDAYSLLARGPDAVGDEETGGDDTSWSGFKELWSDSRYIADREGFLHWEAAFPGVWQRWQEEQPVGGFDAVIGNPPWDRIKFQEVEWFATRSPGIALAPTAAARKTAIQRLRASGAPFAAEFDAAREQAEGLADTIRASSDYPLLGGRRHQPLLPIRRARYEARQTRRFRGPAHALRHLRRQDGGGLFQVRLHQRTCVRPVRLREPPSWFRADALLPRRGLAVLVLRPDIRRCGAAVPRDRVRLLPPRHRNHQRLGALLCAGPLGLRTGEPQHRHRAHISYAAGRGDHPAHLRAASGARRPLTGRGAQSVARPVRADVRYDQRLTPVSDGGSARFGGFLPRPGQLLEAGRGDIPTFVPRPDDLALRSSCQLCSCQPRKHSQPLRQRAG